MNALTVAVVLTIVFVVLRVADVIDWPWYWLVSPMWIYLILLVVLAIIGAIADAVSK